MQHPHLDTILSELRAQLKALYGDRLVRLVLYGSQARREAEPYSDVDVLVVLTGPVDSSREIERTSDIRLDLSLRYATIVSCVYVSEERFAQEQSPLLLNVRKEGVPL